MDQIEQEWKGSGERENLIKWTAEKNGAEKEAVSEWYDRQWEEIKSIICERKREKITKEWKAVNIRKIYEYGVWKESL